MEANNRKGERVVASPPLSHTAQALYPFLCLLLNLRHCLKGFDAFSFKKLSLTSDHAVITYSESKHLHQNMEVQSQHHVKHIQLIKESCFLEFVWNKFLMADQMK